MASKNSVVATFDQHSQAEDAIKQLQQAGFDMKKLSIVGKGYHTEENVVGYYTTGDRVKYWGANGAFWGGIWGMLFGSAFFFIPGRRSIDRGRVTGRMDRRGPGGSRRCRRPERPRGRALQHWHPQE